MLRLVRFRFSVRRGMAMVIVFALLATILKPMFEAQLDQMSRDECVANLKQLGIAIHQYHGFYDSFPPGVVANASLPPDRRLGWVVPLWPQYSDATRLDVDLARAWDAPPNWPPSIASKGPSVPATSPGDHGCTGLTCPNERSRGQARPSNLSYVGVAGLGADAATLPSTHPRAGVFGYDRTINFANIQDGLSNTMMVIETTNRIAPFTAGGPRASGRWTRRLAPILVEGDHSAAITPGARLC